MLISKKRTAENPSWYTWRFFFSFQKAGFEDQQRMKQEVDLPVFKQTIYVIDKIAM